MKGLFKTTLMLILLLLGMNSANHALAASPVGLWRVTSFLEPNLTVAGSRDLCFRADETFHESRPNPNEFFSGFWFKKGDRIRFVGTRILTVDLGFQGRTANFGQFTNNFTFGGEFYDLIIDGDSTSTASGNFVARRLRSSC
jgi:hypothetical protein